MNPNNSFKRGLNRLKEEWERRPLTVLFITGFAANGIARLIDAQSIGEARRAYAKQVDYNTQNKL